MTNAQVIFGRPSKEPSCEISSNNCFFMAISALYGIKGRKVFLLKKKRNTRCLKRAKRLKFAYLRFMREKYPNEITGISRKGLNGMVFPFVEVWLSAQINMFSLKRHDALKLDRKTVTIQPDMWKGTRKKCREYVCERYSQNAKYTKVVNLLCQDQHIYCILDAEKQCKAYYCTFCNKKYEDIRNLRKHNCRDKKMCYRSEKPVLFNTNLNHDLKAMDSSMTTEEDLSFAYIAISKNQKSEFELNIDIKKCSEVIVKLNYCFESIEQCGKFVINVLHDAAAEILKGTLLKNMKNIDIVQRKIDGMADDSLLFGRNVTKLENNHIMKTKDKFMAYLSFLNVFIAGNELQLVDMLMNSILLDCIEKSGQESVQTVFYKGKLARITMKKKCLIFKCLNYISSILIHENVKENGFAMMNNLINAFQKEFGMNLCHLTSGPVTGVEILSTFLKPMENFKLLSPCTFLSQQLENYSRYGLLTTSRHIVGQGLEYKSVVHMDYEKYYLSCFSDLEIPTGIGIKYILNDKNSFVCHSSTRKRSAYANLFFAFLKTVLKSNINLIYSFVYGCEFRSGQRNKTVDAILIDGPKKTVLEFEGCLWHLHCLVKDKLPCHYNDSTQPLGHKSTCRLCTNIKSHSTNPVFPQIFKFRKNETEKSRHRVRKNLTYEEVYLQDENTKMSNFGPACDNVIFVKECDIGRYFDGTVSEFFGHFGLGEMIKNEVKDLIFGEEMLKASIEMFPLMRFHGKVNQKSFIRLLRFKKFSGFVNLSIQICEKKVQEIYGYAKPFAFRSEDGKEVIYSWNIKNKTVPFDMVKYLLNKAELQTRVLNVNWFIEFSSSEKIFHGLKSVAMKAMENQRENDVFTHFLKFALNSSFGWMGKKSDCFKNTILTDKEQFLSMNEMRLFIGANPLSERFNWLHFKNPIPTLNLSHIHISILSHAKIIMLEFISNLTKFLHVKVVLTNCDSCTIISTKELDLQICDDTCLMLDQYLKYDDCVNMSEYIDWKTKCFLKPGVCFSHLDEYKLKLQKQIEFQPMDCCVSFINQSDYPYKMKMEFSGDKGLILGSTHFSLYNSYKQTDLIKSSGKLNPAFPLVKNCLPSDLHKLI